VNQLSLSSGNSHWLSQAEKIQVKDQRIDLAGDPVGNWVKHSIYMPVYGISNTTLSQSVFALKHAYDLYLKSMQFYNPRKCSELFANSVIGTAGTHWEKVAHEFVQVAGFQETLEYFCSCLQAWVKAYFGEGRHCKYFAFMQARGSLIKFEKLKIDEYLFWEAIFLYNELGDFLWPDPVQPILKWNKNEPIHCFYDGQPKQWHQQFKESPNAPNPEDRMVEELKEHFKTKEDNHAKMQLKPAEQQ